MPKTLLFRNAVRYESLLPPHTDTHGLELFHEEWHVDGKRKTFLKYGLPDVAVVIALTPENQIIGITEWQPGVGSEYLHTVGETIEEGESPATAARRGLLEETGYDSEDMELVSAILENSSRSGRLAHIFLARNCTKKKEGEKGIAVGLFAPADFWSKMMDYFLADPAAKHGGANTLKALALVYRKLSWLQMGPPSAE